MAPVEIFISYSHKDEALRERLGTHLSLLKRQGVIDAWHDRQIGAGDEWAGAIDAHLNSAAVILLLVSADFLASDYCYDLEMTRALERHDAGDARVIPVILRSVDWRGRALRQASGAAEGRQAGDLLARPGRGVHRCRARHPKGRRGDSEPRP